MLEVHYKTIANIIMWSATYQELCESVFQLIALVVNGLHTFLIFQDEVL